MIDVSRPAGDHYAQKSYIGHLPGENVRVRRMNQVGTQIQQRGDGVPYYVRLAASLRTRIARGEWAIGSRLPPFEELSATYGVALNTVRKAIDQLVGEGMLLSGRGRGTTVASAQPQVLESALLQEMHDPLSDSQELEIEVLSCDRGTSLPPGLLASYRAAPSYVRVIKTHSIRGSPYGLFDVFVDEQSFKRFPRNALTRTKLTRLLRDYGRSQVLQTRQQLTITYADDAVASILRCPPASSLVRVRRWKITAKSRLALACEILYRGDMFIWDSTEDDTDSHPIVPDVRSAG